MPKNRLGNEKREMEEERVKAKASKDVLSIGRDKSVFTPSNSP